jgi:MerR HTH family regulatory protein
MNTNTSTVVETKPVPTAEVARRAGISPARLAQWLASGKIERPKMILHQGRLVWLWTEDDIERVRLFSAAFPGRHYSPKNRRPDPRAAGHQKG